MMNEYIFIIIILLILVIIATLIRRYYKKKIKKIKKNGEEIITLLSSIVNITETDKKNSEIFNVFIRHFGKLLRSELCCLGFASNELFRDFSTYYRNELENTQLASSIFVKETKLDNKTIVGSLFNKELAYDFIENKNVISKSKFYKPHVRDILKSGKIENVATWALYCKKTPVAYLQAINVNKKVLEDNLQLLNQVVKHLEFVLCRQKTLKFLKDLQKDEKFILERFSSHDSLEDSIVKIMDYFISEFNLFTVSFRTPRKSRLKDKNSKNIDDIILPLRLYSISKNIEPKIKKQIGSYFQKNKNYSLSETSYFDDFYKENGLRTKFDKNYDLSKFYNLVELNDKNYSNIIYPIYKPWANHFIEEHNNLFGIFYLRGYNKSHFGEVIIERLGNIAFHISQLISKFLNQRVTNKIEKFTANLSTLDFKDYDNFLYNLCNLIRGVIDSENVSLFIKNKEKDALILEATTASKVYCYDDLLEINEVPDKNKVFSLVNEKNSLVVKSFLNREITTIHCISEYNKNDYVKKFVESERPYAHSVLLIPIFNIANEPIGIIKCVGKLPNSDNLFNSFWEHDIKLIELISRVITRFRENVLINKEKSTFIESFCHEIASPLNCVVHDFECLEENIRYLDNETGHLYSKISRDKALRLLETNIEMFSRLIDNLYFIKKQDSDENNYVFSLSNVENIIIDITKSLSSYAESLRGNKIIAKISNLPKLKVDVEKFKQIIHNLLKNAIYYSYSNTIIYVFYSMKELNFSGSRYKRWHEISFVNSGKGIEPEDKFKIFNIYQRGANAMEMRPDGTGIGLYIVKSIMEKHNGFCKVEQLKNPTRISIYFPKI